MQVKFRTNLGSAAAAEFDLDFRQCAYEAVLEVPGDLGKRLCDRGYAEALPPSKAEADEEPQAKKKK